jgi:hypothetical protein
VLIGLALGALVLAFVGSRLRGSYRTTLTGCARDPGTGGGAGLFRWAERIGIPVRLLEDPLWEGSRSLPSPTGNCVITMGNGDWTPVGGGPDHAEEQRIHDWLARGNALVIVTSDPASIPASLRQGLIPSAPQAPATGRAALLGEGSVPDRPATSQATVTTGGSLTVAGDGPRWGGTTPAGGDNDLARSQLAADHRGGVLFRFPIGQGSLYVLLDAYAWTNAGLDQGENAPELAEILAREVRGGVLALDEYRHGHGRMESFLTYLLGLPGSSAFLWLAFLWAVLYFYGRNVRLRPVEPYRERERRTAREHIDAVAQLYERARAAPLVVQAVARRLRQVSRSAPEPPPTVEAALRGAETYAGSDDRPAAPSAAIRLAGELLQLRKRVYGSRKVP